MTHCLRSLFGSLLLLAACHSAPADAPADVTNAPADVTDAPANVASAPAEAAPSPRPRYEGTYAYSDGGSCALSITIARRDTSYTFECASPRASGPVQVWHEGYETGFTFVGLKGVEPEEDISCAWQDSLLLIQNYGNAMNEYTRFNCGDKYLELRRQQ